MNAVPRAIHQFHAGSAFGDGVTNGLFFTRSMLRELGFASEIYCVHVAPELAGEIRSFAAYESRPDQVLLLHHSMGYDEGAWVEGLNDRLALVYHNITPASFFPPESPQHAYSLLGRRQLSRWRHRFQAAIGDSSYNSKELEELGYAPVDTLPLLVDLDAVRARPHDIAFTRALQDSDAFTVLFVGRIVPNKRQEDIILAIEHLRSMLARPIRLILAGAIGSHEYRDHLSRLCAERGLTGIVEFTGSVSEARLGALYRGCDAFLCLSRHEGFGMPLIEAMAFDLPVIAGSAASIADTVGQGGLLFDDNPDPAAVAATLKVLADEPGLRRRLIEAGRRNIARFARPRLLAQLGDFLKNRLDVAVPRALPRADQTMAGPSPGTWRIEGPFDSSYSLAVVNRNLASALSDTNASVELFATEGPGDYQPDAGFLTAHPGICDLWERGRPRGPADIVLRNLYPPRVTAMRGHTRVLSNYGWEESAFPPAYVEQFNKHLNLVTTVSTFVARVLEDNGVRAPIAVVGNGTDHLRGVAPKPPARSLGCGTFRFLHVSSCFPRKGLDALLKAWATAFTSRDMVTLVIKTFPNPHNDAERQVTELARSTPGHAEIVLINEDMDDAEMAGLYQACDALVAPSRGEGYGLPLAEAMWFERPVITTAYGGQVDFCNERTAWLVDYRFAYAQTHLDLFDSVWVDPNVEDLAHVMRVVRSAAPETLRQRTSAALDLVRRRHTWAAVAERTRRAVAALDGIAAVPPLPVVAWVTTWNTRCGVASYARFLASAFPGGVLRVLANKATDLHEPDGPDVKRCWTSGWDDDLDELHTAIRESGASTAVIQFNFGFFDLNAFGRLLDRLHADGIECNVILHSTKDVIKPERRISLGQIKDSLSRARRLLVHGVSDLNTLKSHGLVRNVTLFPHGVTRRPVLDVVSLKRASSLDGRKVIACTGFLLPHKGIRQLIEAFFLLKKADANLHLLLLNALYPVSESALEEEACRKLISSQPAGNSITLITEFLPEEQALAVLQMADLMVYPYQHTQESSSAAVRFGLAAEAPVACTPLAIFEDVGSVVHMLPGTTSADLARGIGALLADRGRLSALKEKQKRYLDSHNWEILSTRLWNMLQGRQLSTGSGIDDGD